MAGYRVAGRVERAASLPSAPCPESHTPCSPSRGGRYRAAHGPLPGRGRGHLGRHLGAWGPPPWWFGEQRRAADTPHPVVQVLDGDTIVVCRLLGGTDETIRLLGVDTPETHHPTKPVQCFGPEAAAYTTRRLFGQVVRLEDDVERHDIYRRRLAYVYLRRPPTSSAWMLCRATRLAVGDRTQPRPRGDMLDDELNARGCGRRDCGRSASRADETRCSDEPVRDVVVLSDPRPDLLVLSCRGLLVACARDLAFAESPPQ